MIVAVERDGTVYWRDDRTIASKLASAIQDGLANGAERRIYVKADARVKYAHVIEVLDSIHSAGVKDVTFIVDNRTR